MKRNVWGVISFGSWHTSTWTFHCRTNSSACLSVDVYVPLELLHQRNSCLNSSIRNDDTKKMSHFICQMFLWQVLQQRHFWEFASHPQHLSQSSENSKQLCRSLQVHGISTKTNRKMTSSMSEFQEWHKNTWHLFLLFIQTSWIHSIVLKSSLLLKKKSLNGNLRFCHIQYH